ncbi:hypothetical protein C0J52_09679 [Blattella germanica]|nr:hypothetical protein C0J52_09679 [Blattella germanica]
MMQTKPDLDSVQITCSARGVYPEPKMALLRGSKAATSLDDVRVKTVPRQGSYDIVASKVVQDSDLQTPTVFACELRIPEANYAVRKSVVYYPGKLTTVNVLSYKNY